MTHPPNVCAHCENGRNTVKKNNGFIFEFQIVDGVLMEICLHDGCVEPWCRAFGVLSPLRDSSLSRDDWFVGLVPRNAQTVHQVGTGTRRR
jgi:hypothetical protein